MLFREQIWKQFREFAPFFVMLACMVIGISASFQPRRACEGVHITPGRNPGQMTIMWMTDDAREGTVRGHNMKTGRPFILESWSFKLEENHSSFVDSYVIHRAFAENLQTGAEYMYHPYTYEGGHISYTFRTWPENRDFRTEFLLYHTPQDSTLDTHHYLTQGVQRDHRFAGVFNLGKFECKQNYKEYLRKMADMSAWIPILTTTGRSDISDDFRLYQKVFSMPGVVWPQQHLWYSFDIGRAHIISISSDVYFAHSKNVVQQQRDWLSGDLQAANQRKQRGERPWIIVILNKPFYCSGTQSCYADSEVVRKDLEKLVHTQGVDLVITAQDNLYERTWPVYEGKVQSGYLNPEATVYINSGSLTCSNISLLCDQCQASWSAKKIPLNGSPSYGILSIHNKTHLLYQELDAVSRNLLDSTWIVQHHHGPFSANIGHHPYIAPLVVAFTLTIAFVVFCFLWGKRVKKYLKFQRDMRTNRRTGHAFNFTSLDETEIGMSEDAGNDDDERPDESSAPLRGVSEESSVHPQGVSDMSESVQNEEEEVEVQNQNTNRNVISLMRTKAKNIYVIVHEDPCEHIRAEELDRR